MGVQAVETVKTGMEGVTSALTAGFTSVATSMTGVIGDIIPIALPVVGAVLVVGFGIKAFKKVSGNRG